MAKNQQTKPVAKAAVQPTTETAKVEDPKAAGEGATDDGLEDGPEVSVGELFAAARETAGLSVEEWAALEDSERDAMIQAEVDKRMANKQNSEAGDDKVDPVGASSGEAEGSSASGATDALLGSSTIASIVVIAGADVSLGDLVAAAHTASGLSVDDWNALDDEARDALIHAEIDRRFAEADPGRVDIDTGAVDGSTPDVHIESDDEDHQDQDLQPRRTLTKAFQNAKAAAQSSSDHAAYAAFNGVEVAAGEFRRAMAAAVPHVEAAKDDGFIAEIVADVLRSF